jgi:hypothetical protein
MSENKNNWVIWSPRSFDYAQDARLPGRPFDYAQGFGVETRQPVTGNQQPETCNLKRPLYNEQ